MMYSLHVSRHACRDGQVPCRVTVDEVTEAWSRRWIDVDDASFDVVFRQRGQVIIVFVDVFVNDSGDGSGPVGDGTQAVLVSLGGV